MPIYKVKSHFSPWSKKFDRVQKNLIAVIIFFGLADGLGMSAKPEIQILSGLFETMCGSEEPIQKVQ